MSKNKKEVLDKITPFIKNEFPILKENYFLQKDILNSFENIKKNKSYEDYLKTINAQPITSKEIILSWILAGIVYIILFGIIIYFLDKGTYTTSMVIVFLIPLSIYISYKYCVSIEHSVIYNYFGRYPLVTEDEYYASILGITLKEYRFINKFIKPEYLYTQTPMTSLFIVNSFCEKNSLKKLFKNDIPLPLDDINDYTELIEYVKKNDKTKYYFD